MSTEDQIRLEILSSAPLDSWIALSRDEKRLVAVGKDYREVVEKADSAGEPDPLILKTPSEWGQLSL